MSGDFFILRYDQLNQLPPSTNLDQPQSLLLIVYRTKLNMPAMIINQQLTQYPVTAFHQPTILLRFSFRGGYNREPWDGDDWNEYVRGKNARDWYDRNAQGPGNSHKSPPGNLGNGSGPGGGGGDGCGGIIALLVLALLVIIPSAIAALFGSLLLIFSIIITKGALPKLPFKLAYTASFLSIVVYLLTALALTFIQTLFFPILNDNPSPYRLSYVYDEKFSAAAFLKFFILFEEQNPVSLKHLLIFHVPCLLLSAIPLCVKIYSLFYGVAGYAKAVLTSLLTTLPSILIAMYITAYILLKYVL